MTWLTQSGIGFHVNTVLLQSFTNLYLEHDWIFFFIVGRCRNGAGTWKSHNLKVPYEMLSILYGRRQRKGTEGRCLVGGVARWLLCASERGRVSLTAYIDRCLNSPNVEFRWESHAFSSFSVSLSLALFLPSSFPALASDSATCFSTLAISLSLIHHTHSASLYT